RSDLDEIRLDEEFPAGGHRIAGVYGQVQEDLLELAGIRTDDDGIMSDDTQFDVFSDQTVQHATRRAEEAAQIDRFRPEHLATAEREELPCQLVGRMRCASDLVEVHDRRGVAVNLRPKHLAVPVDRKSVV